MIDTGTRTDTPGPIERKFMDESVRAGDDFFQYANGAWLAATKIPDDEPGWGGFSEVRDRNFAVLHEILEDAAKDDASGVKKLVGDLYASGLDEAAIEREQLAEVRDILVRAATVNSREELPAVLGWLQRRGVRAGLALRVMPDAFKSTRNLIHLMQGGLGLPDRDYYLKDDDKSRELQEKYRAHVARMFVLLGDEERAASADARSVYDFEHALATASMPRVEQRDPYKVNNPTTRAQLDELAPGFDWSAFLREIGAPEAKDFNVRQPKFLTALAGLVRERSLDEWRMYLRLRVINAYAPYLPKRFED